MPSTAALAPSPMSSSADFTASAAAAVAAAFSSIPTPISLSADTTDDLVPSYESAMRSRSASDLLPRSSVLAPRSRRSSFSSAKDVPLSLSADWKSDDVLFPHWSRASAASDVALERSPISLSISLRPAFASSYIPWELTMSLYDSHVLELSSSHALASDSDVPWYSISSLSAWSYSLLNFFRAAAYVSAASW